jgi:hypothetical protein
MHLHRLLRCRRSTAVHIQALVLSLLPHTELLLVVDLYPTLKCRLHTWVRFHLHQQAMSLAVAVAVVLHSMVNSILLLFLEVEVVYRIVLVVT